MNSLIVFSILLFGLATIFGGIIYIAVHEYRINHVEKE